MAEAAQPSEAPQWEVVISGGEITQKTHVLTQKITSIGREADNDIVLADEQVSGYQGRFIQQAQHLLFDAVGGEYETLLNGSPLTHPVALEPGDTLTLGSYTLSVHQTVAVVPLETQAAPDDPAGTTGPAMWPFLLIIALVLMALIVLFASFLVGRWYLAERTADIVPTAASPAVPVIVVNQGPAQDSEIPINQSTTIQATAQAPAGIVRMELWVNNQLIEQLDSPLEQSASSMAAAFQWTASSAGTYELQVKAYSEDGQTVDAQVATVLVLDITPTPTVPATATVAPSTPTVVGTATPTITPLPPTPSPTPTLIPSPTMTPTPTAEPATLQVGVPLLNVRTGPGTQYSRLGTLQQGDNVNLVGQARVGSEQWWEIEFSSSPTGTGWVSGNTVYVSVKNASGVPISMVPLPPQQEQPQPTPSSTFQPSPTATSLAMQVKQAPPGKTLLIVSNRSLSNRPARLTLSGGKSVAGGKEIDPPAGGEIEVILEPDFYRALWSTPVNNFTRGVDFTAVPSKIIVMWIVPETGVTMTEMYDELVTRSGPESTPTPTPLPPDPRGLVAPPGMGLLVASNRSIMNEFGVLTIAGGNYGGGKEIILDANSEVQLELLPGYTYRTIWHSPARGGVNAGREFPVTVGEVIYGWIVPEDRAVFMRFPGQPEIQINN
jgi:hypothetical protein